MAKKDKTLLIEGGGRDSDWDSSGGRFEMRDGKRVRVGEGTTVHKDGTRARDADGAIIGADGKAEKPAAVPVKGKTNRGDS